MIYEIVPEEKLPVFGGLAFAIVALATVIGPLLGGAIDTSASWRWIFLFKYAVLFRRNKNPTNELSSVPVGFVAFLTLFIAMPAKFPYHMEMEEPFWPITFPKRSAASPSISNKFWSLLKKMDCVGGVLVLAASFTLVTPLLQVSIIFQWSSPVTISLLVLSGLLWTSFFTWEWYLSSGKISREQEPIFPWRFVHNRPFLGILL
jgi:MFS family permease